jgi:hypothetical protein
MARFAAVLTAVFLTFSAYAAPTTKNDDSCDISVMPAATLLLPYFEVDVTDPNGATTLFTVTNASAQEQLANVTLWTDRGYKVINFLIYLTGYDVQAINLYDVIARGIIAPEEGTGIEISPSGDFSDRNPRLELDFCARLPGLVPQVYRTRMIEAFTLGRVPAFGTSPACAEIGGRHTNAVGYATIDLVRTCGSPLPVPEDYYGQTILWDNVLTGDFQQVNRGSRFAEGSPMVHIRAIPEGGTAEERRANPDQYGVTFPRTFYSGLQPSTPENRVTFDARQPLPSTFAARWIQGGPGSYQTFFKIWREPRTPLNAPCASYAGNLAGLVESITFDEEENPNGAVPLPAFCAPIDGYPTLPSAAMVDSGDAAIFAPPTSGAVAGWMYFNLDNCTQDTFGSQNWVVTSMRAEGQFSIDMDATILGNGCTPPIPTSEIQGGTHEIGPAPNANP